MCSLCALAMGQRGSSIWVLECYLLGNILMAVITVMLWELKKKKAPEFQIKHKMALIK